MPIVCMFVRIIMPVSLFCLFHHISDGGRPRIESGSSTAKNLGGQEGVQSRDATSMPMLEEVADRSGARRARL
jgi:hypothetical protein